VHRNEQSPAAAEEPAPSRFPPPAAPEQGDLFDTG
jgi:hypothetical protein